MTGGHPSDRSGRSKPATGRTAPSQADVARLAGVSGQTVSRVANGADSVTAQTRARVEDAMNMLGYSPNRAARALRSGTFNTIGIITHKLSRTGESRTVEAVVQAARRAGHGVTLIDVASPSFEHVTQAASQLSDLAIDGLIVIRAEGESAEALVIPPGLPVVVSDSNFLGAYPSVGADQEGGVRRAVEHLQSLGHTAIGFVGGPLDSIPATLRLEAWRGALVSAGLPVPSPVIGDWTSRSGYAAGQQIARNRDVTAVVCANDEMALGVMRALHEAGVSVPGDVSVIGFDDVPFAEYVWPPLTTVRQDFDAIGRALVETLLGQLTEGRAAKSRTLIPSDLVIRASTGRVAAI